MPTGIYIRTKCSEETKRKIGLANKGHKCTKETKKKISKVLKGRKLSKETRQKMSENNACYWLNKKLSKKHNKKISLALIGRKLSKEHKKKISVSGKGKHKGNGMSGKQHTKSAKYKLSLAMTGKYVGKKHSEKSKNNMSLGHLGVKLSKEAKEKLSKYMIKLIKLNNGVHPYLKYTKKGKFYSRKSKNFIYYESSFELALFKQLEKDKKIKKYIRCPYIIDYKFKDNKHKYFPDVLLEYFNGSKKIVEVKPNYKLKNEKIKAKFRHARKYCKQNNLGFSIMTENELFN